MGATDILHPNVSLDLQKTVELAKASTRWGKWPDSVEFANVYADPDSVPLLCNTDLQHLIDAHFENECALLCEFQSADGIAKLMQWVFRYPAAVSVRMFRIFLKVFLDSTRGINWNTLPLAEQKFRGTVLWLPVWSKVLNGLENVAFNVEA